MPANSRTSASEIVAGMTADLFKGKAPVWDAKQVTVLLKSSLQTERIAYLQVGRLLVMVRDEKLYLQLQYADLAAYGKEQLELCRATLYRYLQVYDWVAVHHPEWLEPGTNTFIPELNDVDDLMWIEQKLGEKTLEKPTRASLEELKEKALSGKLAKNELRRHRGLGQNKAKDGRKAFLAHMIKLREEGNGLPGLPAEILPGLDQFIGLLKNAMAMPALSLEETRKSSAA